MDLPIIDDDDSLGQQLSEFAKKLITEVADAPVDQKVAAFKALSQFYIATTKLGDKVPAEDGAGGLPAMRAAMKAATANGGK